MRQFTYLIAVAGLTGGSGLLAMGCVDYWTDYYLPLTDPKLATTSSVTGGGGGTGGTGGTGGDGGGGAPPDCSGDPSVTNIIEACAVFVQADAVDAFGDGSREKPYKTLQAAIDKAGSKRVYACESAPFTEAVTLSAALEVVGGFDCAKGWAWKSSARSTLSGPAGANTLTLTDGADKAKVKNFVVVGASAAPGMKGVSSIAVVVADVVAELVRCEVTAGDGANGEDGVTPSDPVMKGLDATPMSATDACVLPAGISAGVPGMTMCNGTSTNGGIGGIGGVTGTDNGNGQKGADGEPPDVLKGKGGLGADALNDCEDGTKGKSGSAGFAASGGISLGMLSLAGIGTAEDTDGKTGVPGQGGGGGGGAKSGVFCKVGMNTFDGVGASGGGGGAGGCGGKGGGGGKAGGSSIAVLSLGKKLMLTEVSLTAGKAGKGGNGASGQGGGAYGFGAAGGMSSGQAGSKAGCKGGDGGAGGDGGPGGGGRGGHALGLAYASAPTKAPMVKNFVEGSSGDGGTAGPGAPMTSNGTKGAAGACWDFAQNAACAP